MIKTILIDNRNFDQVAFNLIQEIKASKFVGVDVETHDDNRHEGLNTFCKYDPVTRKKSPTTKLIFDMRRTVMTGFSIYAEGSSRAVYVNLNHADVENRLPWDKAKLLLEALPEGAYWITHNAAYELTAFRSCYEHELGPYICTMQMAVSSFGPDEYSIRDFISAGQGGIKNLTGEILQLSRQYDLDKGTMGADLEELVGKITAKESTAAHSYNGYVAELAYGYGLKGLVKRFFNYQMTTFEEVLGDKAHMGQLTGEEVASYGAEDAYWAVRLFRHLLSYMSQNCPDTIPTFFNQENPMVDVYAKIWQHGMRVNTEAIIERRNEERENMANILREMKTHVKALLPFPDEPNDGLMTERWYAKNYAKYRKQIVDWANTPDSDDTFKQCQQVRGPVSNAWAKERGLTESRGPNFSHYMPMRVLLYDLCGAKIIRSDGKVQSDGEARGKILDRLDDENALGVIRGLNEIAGVEQRMKLYLTPYTLLMDPETGCLYPTVSSTLASRRMAASNPNPMQLAKRGESTYVRGFFVGDYDDHVVVSVDWSSIELVEIGEFSADPEFIKAFGQIPHKDLHSGAAADILSVEVPGLTEEIFLSLKNFKEKEEFLEVWGHQLANTNRLFTDLKGQPLAIDKAHKYWRTEVGKGANFNYWYSGFLGTIGERMGWSTEKTGEATDRYRSRFHVAEQWRVDTIAQAQKDGFIYLPDGHRRVRFEATPQWMEYFLDKFQLPNQQNDELVRQYNAVWHYIARKIQKRAYNQVVNSVIQGSCATLAKRSVLRINERFKQEGWTNREARFMIPIHDELVFSVHRSLVPEAISIIRGTMIDHPDLFKHCKLDASPSVGLTFEPWHPKSAPLGQIELFEAPAIDPVPENKINQRLNDDEIRGVVEYLFDQQRRLAA